MKKHRLNHSGFTIVELLIATTVFTVILLVATMGIIRIGNIYYKGIITSRVENVIRTVGNDLTTSIQFANSTISDTYKDGAGPEYFCLGNTIYVNYGLTGKYTKGNEFSSGLYSAELATGSLCKISSTSRSCSTPNDVNCYKNHKQILGENMRVLVLKLDPKTQGSITYYDINLRVIYGDDDLLTYYGNDGIAVSPSPSLDSVTCKSGISGSSFCAVGQLDTSVKKRLNT